MALDGGLENVAEKADSDSGARAVAVCCALAMKKIWAGASSKPKVDEQPPTPKVKKPQSASSSAAAAAGPPPKKPKRAEDHYVLEQFRAMSKDDDDPLDIGTLVESELREVVRLVTADNKHDEGMDRGEVLAAAGDLLAQEGFLLRFKKSLVQIQARAAWKKMGNEARAPYEAKVSARLPVLLRHLRSTLTAHTFHGTWRPLPRHRELSRSSG